MSPEQARGEGHRVDGRGDIFSLGVVLYELLVGRPPFQGDSTAETLKQVATQEPRPPREYDEGIPEELERICLKALSKRATERYPTARDLAFDLRHFLGKLPQVTAAGQPAVLLSAGEATTETLMGSHTFTGTHSTDSRTLKIVPKGLRSFDAQDADFFLGLLPGPRDQDGLPDSIRFWKNGIEETDRDETFRVGLLYGPSGCGKSSLVKAGLLPRLAQHVLPIYVEATADETESRLLYGLRRRFAALPNHLDLKETLAALRQGDGLAHGTKVLIVLDQFEQWLHSKGKEENSELVEALRQCDGGRAQCLVTIRDDFWLAVSRFMLALEVDLVPGRNIALIDVFDLDHARKVLAAFGQAFGKLPKRSSENTKGQKDFLARAVWGLAEDGKVICVRLALFAETIKRKSWTPTTLKEVGGAEGVGITFLEETFNAATANPKHRLHQREARAVLKALLPEHGTDIKGNMRSRQELLVASGYGGRQSDFDDLIRILDNEIRLITPTDPEGIDSDSPNAGVEASQKYYQLTHDYLVPSLREWLTEKQRETRRGRAELKLADRAALWSHTRENRHLPSLWEFVNIRLLTDGKNWNEPQRKMMRKAGRFHGIRVGIAAAVAILGLFSAWEINGRFQAASLVKRLIVADISEVPGIAREMDGYRRWADPLLRQEDAHADEKSERKLHLALTLLPVDRSKIAELRDNLLSASPGRFAVARDALVPYRDSVIEPLWNVALDPKQNSKQRFQAACALATYTPDDPRWSQIDKIVVGRLVALEASALVAWREALRPAKARLITPLASIFRGTSQKEKELARTYAAETLADYASEQPDELFSLLADSEQFQFPILFDKLASQKDKAVPLARRELAKRPTEKASEDQKELLAKRQANIAIALLRLGNPDQVWPALKFSPDPRARSDIIHWLSPLGCDPQPIIQRLDIETDVTIRRALVLALGEFTDSQLPMARRQPLIEKLLDVYENEPDAGLHGAAEWLLRKWGQSERLEAVVQKLKSDDKQLQARRASDKRQWYVNTQKQTFVIVDTAEFLMGSCEWEVNRFTNESRHRRHIGRRFAISAHEVTKAQFGKFQRQHFEIDSDSPHQRVKTEDSPQTLINWFEAAQYCNWLSEKQGIAKEQWCYQPNSQGKFGPGMKAKDKFWELAGYRLPTEAEWECACRAGTVTSRHYGASERLLPHYAWYETNGQNRTWPTAALEPNDFGLFDMLGNAWEWCFDRFGSYPEQDGKVFEDTPTTQPVEAGAGRVLRGGSFYNRPSSVRSANRFYNHPSDRNDDVGFRPARTYP
jgi:formylglycine-generating enzyme required for sulfatase activity